MANKGEPARGGEQSGPGARILEAVHEALDANVAFSDLLTTGDRQFLLDHGVVRRALPGERPCEQNQRDNRVYIIVVGEVEVTESVDGDAVHLASLGRGELFGEIAALFNSPRISTVTVSRPSVLLELPGEVLDELIHRLPALRDAVLERYRHRLTETALRAVPLFTGLDGDSLHALEAQTALLSIPPGSPILEEGEPGEALFVIIFGLARVFHTVDAEPINLAILRPGDYFGEWSLLTGAPCAATVSALTQTQVLRIDCRSFLDFIQHNPEVRDRIDQVAYNRHVQTSAEAPIAESAIERDRLLAEIEDIMRGHTQRSFV